VSSRQNIKKTRKSIQNAIIDVVAVVPRRDRHFLGILQQSNVGGHSCPTNDNKKQKQNQNDYL
jgi:hypothetical protein